MEAFAIGDRLEILRSGQDPVGTSALLLGLFLIVERSQVFIGERDHLGFLDLGELVDDLGLGLFLRESWSQDAAHLGEGLNDRWRELGLAGEEIHGQFQRNLELRLVIFVIRIEGRPR